MLCFVPHTGIRTWIFVPCLLYKPMEIGRHNSACVNSELGSTSVPLKAFQKEASAASSSKGGVA